MEKVISKKIGILGSLALLMATSVLARDVVIDVRSAQEFEASHVEGAINIPHTAIAQDIFKAKINKDDHVILYCQSGRRSGLAQDTLKNLAFSNVENYGGFEQAKKRLQKP